MTTAGKNLKNREVLCFHKYLEPMTEGEPFKRWCPMCEEGLLLCARDLGSGSLRRTDHCTMCGQRVQWLDKEIAGEPVEKENGTL